MGRPHVTTPLPARAAIRAARIGLTLVTGFGIVVAAVAWTVGYRALGTWIVVGSALFGITVATLPRWYSVYPTVAGLLVVLWGVREVTPPPITIVAAILTLPVLVYVALQSSRLPRGLTPESLRKVSDDAIGEGSEEYVRLFEELGYTRVGAIAFPIMRSQVIETIMVGPNGDRYAEVTDAVLAVISMFGHRVLVTRNSATTATPAHVITNDVRGADPRELDSEHERALAEIAALAGPDRLDPATLVDHAIDQERATIEWMRSTGAKAFASRSGLGCGPLADDRNRHSRIESWWTA